MKQFLFTLIYYICFFVGVVILKSLLKLIDIYYFQPLERIISSCSNGRKGEIEND